MIHIEEDSADYKSILITCACSDLGHCARISYFIENGSIYDAYMEMILNPFLPWYRRLWFGLRYIIRPGWNIRCSNYDSIAIASEDAKKLGDFLNNIK